MAYVYGAPLLGRCHTMGVVPGDPYTNGGPPMAEDWIQDPGEQGTQPDAPGGGYYPPGIPDEPAAPPPNSAPPNGGTPGTSYPGANGNGTGEAPAGEAEKITTAGYGVLGFILTLILSKALG